MASANPAVPRLMHRLRQEIGVKHYSIRTEQAHTDWVRRFIVFHRRPHPSELGAAEVASFLNHLAVERHVAPATQGQAKSASLFLYKMVLKGQWPWLDKIVAASSPRRLPVGLAASEVRLLLDQLSGSVGFVAFVLYNTGMRLNEGLRLRVKDVEFQRR